MLHEKLSRPTGGLRATLAVFVLLATLAASREPRAARRAQSAEVLNERSVRIVLRDLAQENRSRSIGPRKVRLAPECEIVVRDSAMGQQQVMRLSGAEYLQLTQPLWDNMTKSGISYIWSPGAERIRIEPGSSEAVVTMPAPETSGASSGRVQKIESLSTLRLEPRAGRLLVVSVSSQVGEQR
jgi:hypothetical protein